MSYSIKTNGRQWVRIINLQGTTAKVMKPFDVAWECDPCAGTRQRYQIRHDAGHIQYFPWYGVITNADDARTRFEKLVHAKTVIAAAQVLAAAEHAYRKLVA